MAVAAASSGAQAKGWWLADALALLGYSRPLRRAGQGVPRFYRSYTWSDLSRAFMAFTMARGLPGGFFAGVIA